MFDYITWDVSSFIYEGRYFGIEWYGTLWVLGLLALLFTLLFTFRRDRIPTNYSYICFIADVVCIIFFGHLFQGLFYEWYYSPNNPTSFFGMDFAYRNHYFEHPWKFLDFSHGGFASHGTVFGALLTGVLLEKPLHCNKWYVIDRTMMGLFWIGVAVRIGNMINNEIYGIETSLPWGFKFGNDTVVSHPTQIYETLSYLLTMGLGWWIYLRKDGGRYKGLITAVMTLVVMTLRILIEFIKLPQMAIEQTWTLNMGQWLSIPFAVWAIWLLFYAKKQGIQTNLAPANKVPQKRKQHSRK